MSAPLVKASDLAKIARERGRGNQLERRPAPAATLGAGGAMAWAWMKRDANFTCASGSEVLVDTYETNGGSPGTAFSFDMTAGSILINETGLYVVSGMVQWVISGGNTLPVPSYVRLDFNYSEGWPTSDFINDMTYDTSGLVGKSTVVAHIAIGELLGSPDDLVQLDVAQSSGSSRDVTRATIVITKLADI